MHLHFPSEVPTRGGQCIPAKSWKDYSLSTDDLTYGNAQGRESLCITLFEFVFLMNNFITVILEILQKWFHFNNPADMEHTKVVFEKNEMRLVREAILNAQILATNPNLKKFVGQDLELFRGGSDTYMM
jgi:hypothetical protein